MLHANRLEAAESRADTAAAEAATQAAQLQHLFGRYKTFKSAEVADLDARLRAAMSGGGGFSATHAAGGKENDKAAAALLRLAGPHAHRRCMHNAAAARLHASRSITTTAWPELILHMCRLGPQAIKRRRLQAKEETTNSPAGAPLPSHLEVHSCDHAQQRLQMCIACRQWHGSC